MFLLRLQRNILPIFPRFMFPKGNGMVNIVSGLPLLTVSRDDGNDRDDFSDYPFIPTFIA